MPKVNIPEMNKSLQSVAEEVGGEYYLPTISGGLMEGVPHVWSFTPKLKLIVFSPWITRFFKYGYVPKVGFETDSHEWLTANQFQELYPDCKHFEFRPITELKGWVVDPPPNCS